MALDGLTAQFSIAFNYQALKNAVGAALAQFTGSGTPKKQINFALAGGSVASSINEIYCAVTTIAASGNASIDMTALTDAVRQTSIVAVRLKGVFIQLLSAADDSTIGNACSSITIGNGTNPNALFLSLGTTTFVLNNGECLGWMTPSAAGVTVDGTHKTIKILNNDGANSANVMVALLVSDS